MADETIDIFGPKRSIKLVDNGDGTYSIAISGSLAGMPPSVSSVHSTSHALVRSEDVVVFTATATATLPASNGSGKTFRIVNAGAGVVTVDPQAGDTVRGLASISIASRLDVILTDYADGFWA